MSLSEFDIIQQYFSPLTTSRADVLTGIGDDCALLAPQPGKILAISTDTLVSGIHFLPDVDPVALGHKALAVNLSDLAAMGATPCWVSLALTLPEVNENWLRQFSRGFAALAEQYELQLIGGDTTRGPLAITITVHGQLDPEQVLKRSGAKNGDLVCISGKLGEAALALKKILNGEPAAEDLKEALDYPIPRVHTGRALAGIASACIDISDGLLADLGHICEASSLKAEIRKDDIPAAVDVSDGQEYIETVLSGGDDYELCFTVPESRRNLLENVQQQTGVAITVIGRMIEGQGIEIVDAPDLKLTIAANTGYLHFK